MRPAAFKPEALAKDSPYVRDLCGGKVWHRSRHRSLYVDTDRSGVVYHSNYLIYFELGRTSLMRDAAYPYRDIERDGYVYPIIQVGLDYFKPLVYDDPMYIHTRPSDLERVKLRFDYIITHQETGAIVCKGFTRHCATNRAGTPVAIDEKTLLLWKHFPR